MGRPIPLLDRRLASILRFRHCDFGEKESNGGVWTMKGRTDARGKEPPRIFKSSFLESLTVVHPATPLVLYTPVILYCLYQTYVRFPGARTQAFLVFLAGFLFWTFFEYLTHRFFFHMEPKTAWHARVRFVAHWAHHESPSDARRLVMPPVVSIPIAILSYSIFFLLLGKDYVYAFFGGFVLGYLNYDMLHFAFHHFAMTGRIPKYLKAYHLKHHFKDETAGFGVSSPLWDWVFGTTPRQSGSGRGLPG
jgi:4-hydroxysphinganine ceramide fatty acyl 2-hydroxylase